MCPKLLKILIQAFAGKCDKIAGNFWHCRQSLFAGKLPARPMSIYSSLSVLTLLMVQLQVVRILVLGLCKIRVRDESEESEFSLEIGGFDPGPDFLSRGSDPLVIILKRIKTIFLRWLQKQINHDCQGDTIFLKV